MAIAKTFLVSINITSFFALVIPVLGSDRKDYGLMLILPGFMS